MQCASGAAGAGWATLLQLGGALMWGGFGIAAAVGVGESGGQLEFYPEALSGARGVVAIWCAALCLGGGCAHAQPSCALPAACPPARRRRHPVVPPALCLRPPACRSFFESAAFFLGTCVSGAGDEEEELLVEGAPPSAKEEAGLGKACA